MSLLRKSALALAAVLLCAPRAHAQAPRVDFGITFAADRSLKGQTGQMFWMNGGSAELGINAWRGFGFAANVTGVHTGSIGTSGIPLSLVTATFGPRYRWHAGHKLSIYAEGLIGEANGFHSLFPGPSASQSGANGLATQAGAAIDLTLTRHFALRALQVSWVRTQLPNGADNWQSNGQIGAGFVLRFGPTAPRRPHSK